MKRRILALFLCLVTVFSAFSFTAFASENETTAKSQSVYVTVSKNGKIVSDKDGDLIAIYSLLLNGKDEYNLDDVFEKLHDELYEGGADDGYESKEGQYGLGITKFWGDESGKYGYQVNFGKDTVMGLTHTVKDGDYVDVCVYESYYPDTESYTRFDKPTYECYVTEKLTLSLEVSGYDENWNFVFSPLSDATVTVSGEETEAVTDENGKAKISFDEAGEYVVSASKSKTVGEDEDEKEVTAITAPVCIVKVKELPDSVITVPCDSTLFVGTKPNGKHYVPFAETEPVYVKDNDDETKSYYFELRNNQEYNYRITSDSFMTYGGLFTKKSSGVNITVDEDMLSAGGKSKTYTDRNTSSNSGYNVADIFLNINEKGYLKLSEGDKFQIVNIRNWEATNTTTANYFIEPDYHYTAIDEYGNESECVSVDENGIITAKKDGTAFVLVTYDAINLNFGKGDEVYGAIWPENTGVFVVTVSDNKNDKVDVDFSINEGMNDTSSKLSGDTLDSEHDVIYFATSEGKYTFDPEEKNVEVFVANPSVSDTVSYDGFEEVEKNDDGKFDIPLKQGRNIVKISDGKNETYRVISAKKVNVTVNNGDRVQRGDKISVVFDKLYHPSNKLAGVYNMGAFARYTEVPGYDGKLVGSISSQYNFANYAGSQKVGFVLKKTVFYGSTVFSKESDLTVPEDYEYDEFVLSGGVLCISGFGDAIGSHRNITYENGRNPNMNAGTHIAYFGSLPDISIPITVTDSPLDKIELEGNDFATKYYAGDKFDTDNLCVVAVYEDGTRQKTKNYTISPSVLTKDTTSVTVTYREKTLEIPVEVTVAKVKEIKVTSLPDKTEYKVGNTFDPTGLCVTAVYENGKSIETQEFAYSPNRTLTEDDEQIVITYTGEDAVEDISNVYVPITVTKSSSTGSATEKNIHVYFTLYGDSKHGGEGKAHTLVDGNLTEWIAKTKISLEKNAYVIDAVHKALSLSGIPYQAEENYISSVRGLSEFDNGDYSGWMYTLNGKYPTKGVAEQKLKNGDVIVFHYTDDYTKEETSFSTTTSGGGGSSEKTYVVSFETNGGEKVEAQTVYKNDKAQRPTEPKKDGFKFVDWYTDSAFTTLYDFSSKVAGNITLYAKWEKLEGEEKNENENENTENNDNEFAFDDVSEDMWYYDAVKYVFLNNLMLGTDKGFEPMSNMTRAMLVTVLFRMDGGETAINESPFEDVNTDAWFYEAVLWAYENNIVTGLDEFSFAPNENITREQVALILYRFAMQKGMKWERSENSTNFSDSDKISSWAKEAVEWASDMGIILGDEENRFMPDKSATRAEISAMLMRFSTYFKK